MLIRKPVAEVFEAFVNPANTSKFWFTKGSGRLEAGTQVTWTWEMYNFSVPVDVKVIEPNVRILVEWRTVRRRQLKGFSNHDPMTQRLSP